MTSRRHKNTDNARDMRRGVERLEERQLLSASTSAPFACDPSGSLSGVAEYALFDPSGERLSDASPAAPEQVVVEAVDFDTLRFSWRAAENANRYRIERSVDEGATWEPFRDSVFSTFTFANSDVESALYRVLSVNVLGESSPSAPVLGATLPLLPPQDVEATLLDAQTFKLEWVAPEGEEGLRVVVERSVDGGESWTTLSNSNVGAIYYDSNIPIGAAVRYRLSTLSNAGRLSSPCVTDAYQLPRVAPGTPEEFAATLLDESNVSLAWKPTPGAAFYRLERSLDGGDSWSVLASNLAASSYVDAFSDEADAAEPLYRLSAQNEFGTSDPTAPVAPALPQIRGLWIAEAAPNCATLEWLANARGFRALVERSNDGEEWDALGTTEPDATSWRDATVAPSTEYAYRVSTLSAFGVSAPRYLTFSSPAEVDAPNPPQGIELGELSPVSATLRWSAVDEADAYLIQRSEDGETWRNLARVANTQYVDEYLEPGATYAYRVAVEIDSERSEFSEPVEGTLPFFAPAPLAAPSAYAISRTEIFLSWTRSESGAAYLLERSLDGLEWTTLLNAVDADRYGDSNLAPNTEYRYRLTMRGATGMSTPSRETVVKTCSNLSAPNAPTVGTIATTSISLSWILSQDARSL